MGTLEVFELFTLQAKDLYLYKLFLSIEAAALKVTSMLLKSAIKQHRLAQLKLNVSKMTDLLQRFIMKCLIEIGYWLLYKCCQMSGCCFCVVPFFEFDLHCLHCVLWSVCFWRHGQHSFWGSWIMQSPNLRIDIWTTNSASWLFDPCLLSRSSACSLLTNKVSAAYNSSYVLFV